VTIDLSTVIFASGAGARERVAVAMTRPIFAAVLLSVILVAGCGLLNDPHSIVLAIVSGNQDTLTVGATDTISYSVRTPWTPVSMLIVSQTGNVTCSVTPTGDITDSSFTGIAYLTGKTIGIDTVQLQVWYHGGVDAVKYVYIIVH
jgi:hypothetical protein